MLAIPCDMEIAGYDTDHVNTLRLWDAKSPKPIDMKLFSQGQYLHAAEERGHGRRHQPRCSTPRTTTTRASPCG